MKLNLSGKQNSIQAKVNSILGNNNDNTGKEKSNMKLNFSKKTESIETPKNTKLQLNKTKSVMENNNNMTIDKFDRVEKLSKSIDSIETTFIDFLKNQNESIAMVNSFNKKIDNLEILILNGIKNQKSILDAINSIHAKAFQNKGQEKEKISDSDKPVETILRKKDTSEVEIDSDNPEMIYNAFMELFKGNFKGTKELTEINSFIPFISAIDFDSIASITKSYEKYFSAYLKENNNKQLIARKSKSNAINSLIELGKALGLEINTTLDDTDINSTPIDKAYFTKLFNLDMACINDLITESVEYGKVDDTLIDTISNFIKSDMPDISDNQLGQFIKYIKTYIDKA